MGPFQVYQTVVLYFGATFLMLVVAVASGTESVTVFLEVTFLGIDHVTLQSYNACVRTTKWLNRSLLTTSLLSMAQAK